MTSEYLVPLIATSAIVIAIGVANALRRRAIAQSLCAIHSRFTTSVSTLDIDGVRLSEIRSQLFRCQPVLERLRFDALEFFGGQKPSEVLLLVQRQDDPVFDAAIGELKASLDVLAIKAAHDWRLAGTFSALSKRLSPQVRLSGRVRLSLDLAAIAVSGVIGVMLLAADGVDAKQNALLLQYDDMSRLAIEFGTEIGPHSIEAVQYQADALAFMTRISRLRITRLRAEPLSASQVGKVDIYESVVRSLEAIERDLRVAAESTNESVASVKLRVAKEDILALFEEQSRALLDESFPSIGPIEISADDWAVLAQARLNFQKSASALLDLVKKGFTNGEAFDRAATLCLNCRYESLIVSTVFPEYAQKFGWRGLRDISREFQDASEVTSLISKRISDQEQAGRIAHFAEKISKRGELFLLVARDHNLRNMRRRLYDRADDVVMAAK